MPSGSARLPGRGRAISFGRDDDIGRIIEWLEAPHALGGAKLKAPRRDRARLADGRTFKRRDSALEIAQRLAPPSCFTKIWIACPNRRRKRQPPRPSASAIDAEGIPGRREVDPTAPPTSRQATLMFRWCVADRSKAGPSAVEAR